MNKRLKFLLSLILVFAIVFGTVAVPASSFATDVETSTEDMLLINVDTDTVVFSQKPDNKWYLGYLAELMTFLLAAENISAPETVTYQVKKSFIDGLPFSDGCLEPYIGQTLTAKDLMAIMLYTSGSDAAYALADIVSKEKRDAFVRMMNLKAGELGCTRTRYLAPGYSEDPSHNTTCSDLYRVYTALRANDLFNSVMAGGSYTFDGYEKGDFEHTILSEASIFNENSPYYFRYVNDAKFSYTNQTYAGIALTTTYRGKTYFFAGLLGLNTSEKNVFGDARKLTTWAYLNLSEQKVFNSDETISELPIITGWGEYKVELYPFNSAYKMLPNTYDTSKLTYRFDVPDSLKAPFRAGQAVGSAMLMYEGEDIDKVDLIVGEEEGLNMLSDTGRFFGYVLDHLMPNEPYIPEEETLPPAPTETMPETEPELTMEG